MNAELALRSAMLDALRADTSLAGQLNGVFEERPLQATVPYAVMLDSLATDWSSKSFVGREVRVALALFDRDEGPARIAALADVAEQAIAALASELDGWRIASLVHLRSRLLRDGPQSAPAGWRAEIEFRARMVRN